MARQGARGFLDLRDRHLHQSLIECSQRYTPIDAVDALLAQCGRTNCVDRPRRFGLLALELLLPVARVPWDRLICHRRNRGAQTAPIDSNTTEDRPLGHGTRHESGTDPAHRIEEYSPIIAIKQSDVRKSWS